jgi:hypothetical protein
MMRGKPEDDLQTAVFDLCKLLGLHTAHFRPALTKSGRWITAVGGDGKGWPDLTIVGPGGILFRELKSATGSRSVDQRRWAEWLTEAGADIAVWKPRDLVSGRIEAELTALRRPARTLTGVPA